MNFRFRTTAKVCGVTASASTLISYHIRAVSVSDTSFLEVGDGFSKTTFVQLCIND